MVKGLIKMRSVGLTQFELKSTEWLKWIDFIKDKLIVFPNGR